MPRFPLLRQDIGECRLMFLNKWKKNMLSHQDLSDCMPLRQEEYNSTPEILELLCTECILGGYCIYNEQIDRGRIQ